MSTRPRLKPSHVALALGVFWAVLTALSGIAATIFQFHNDSEVTRPILGNVPAAMKAAFYVLTPIAFLAVGWLFAQRMQNWERGQPDRRATTTKNIGKRLADFRAGVYMQTLLRDG